MHRVRYLLFLVVTLGFASTGLAEQFQLLDPQPSVQLPPNATQVRVRPGSQQLTMTVNNTKFLVLEGKQVPKTLINNPELLSAFPLSPNQIQLVAKKPGTTQITLWDDEGQLYTIDIVVHGNAKELQLLLATELPEAALKVRPLNNSVILSGWVDDPETISRAVMFAEDYYPKVLNNIRVGSNQQVQLHVQVMEVSRTKLRQLGVDWSAFGTDDFAAQSVSGLIAEVTSNSRNVVGTGGSTLTFGLANGDFFAAVDALQQLDFVKVLAEPTLTTLSGRPAAFKSGGEFPILVPQGLGTVGIEYKQFGTRVDFVPIVMGNGNIRLEVRPQVSEVDNSRGVDLNGVRVPGLRSRWVDTAVELRAGQTLALAGIIQERVEAQNRGLPHLADLPMVGSVFRRVRHNINEIELLVMVRPEFVDAMDPEEVPMFGPGEQSGVPTDNQLYSLGRLEVSTQCCTNGDCQKCRPGRGEFTVPAGASGTRVYSQSAPVSVAPSVSAPMSVSGPQFVRLRDQSVQPTHLQPPQPLRSAPVINSRKTRHIQGGTLHSVIQSPAAAQPAPVVSSDEASSLFPSYVPPPAAVPLPAPVTNR